MSAKYDVYGPSLLTERERKSGFDLRSSLSIFELFNAIQQDLGVQYSSFNLILLFKINLQYIVLIFAFRFSSTALERIQRDPKSLGQKPFEFAETDIEGFSVKSRHLLDDSISTYYNSLLQKYFNSKDSSEKIFRDVGLTETETLNQLFGESLIEVHLVTYIFLL